MNAGSVHGSPVVRIGTRGSALAMAQARQAAAALRAQGVEAELATIETEGDARAVDTPWGEGAFVGAIERALIDGRVDLAVHSAKDIPTDEDVRLRIVAYLPRADPRDALVPNANSSHATLASMPPGHSIGTDSPRRTGFLRARRPDLEVVPLHGNVDTRLHRLDEGVVDALVLAAAGLDRLGRADRISQRIAVDELPPAPGQGAIALQARAGDAHLARLGAAIDDPMTRAAVEAERTFLAATGGGCRAPIGAMASVVGAEIDLLGGFATLDGRASAVEHIRGPVGEAGALAAALAERLVTRRAELADRGRVRVTRPGAQHDRLVARLSELGLSAEVVPAIEIRPVADPSLMVAEMRRLARYTWVIATSANGADAALAVARDAQIDPRAGRWAAVGQATSDALAAGGVGSMWRPTRARGAAIAEELPISTGAQVLLLRGSLAADELPRRLRERGAEVTEIVAYETIEAPAESRPKLERVLSDGSPAAILLASPSAVRGLLTLAGERRTQVLALPALCIGPTTGAAARMEGFETVAEAPTQAASALAELAAELLGKDETWRARVAVAAE